MEIDALHSALLSLTVLPEQIRSVRENISSARRSDPSALSEFLRALERDLRLAKAALARELGFGVCHCCWPPELIMTDADGRIYCPASADTRSEKTRLAEPSSRTSSSGREKTKKPRRDSFTLRQREKLFRLRDTLLDSITGVAKTNLRSGANGAEAPVFVGDFADAGGDALEHDFALTLLSKEHDALQQIERALKRIDDGIYGVCEMSGQPIPRARLEAIPFARCTVECQSQIEQQGKTSRTSRSAAPPFDLVSDESAAEAERNPRAQQRSLSLAERIVMFESAETALHPRFAVG